MDMKELELGVNPKSHWYYQSKKLPLIRFVKEIFLKHNQKINLIDYGAGSGFFLYELIERFPEMINHAYMVDIEYSKDETIKFGNCTVHKLKELPEKIENSIIIMMDVLEHLPDPIACLAEIKKIMIGNNYFFITVPAFNSLWSGHDIYLGHYRRYTKSSLFSALKQVDFTIYKIYYLYFAIFPFVWISRKLGNKLDNPKSSLKPCHPWVNRILKNFHALGMRLSKFNRCFGLTCVAEGTIQTKQPQG